jgi:hypothetical protein
MKENNSRATQLQRLLKLRRVNGVCRVCTVCFVVKGLLLLSRPTLNAFLVASYFLFVEIAPTVYMLHVFNSTDEEDSIKSAAGHNPDLNHGVHSSLSASLAHDNSHDQHRKNSAFSFKKLRESISADVKAFVQRTGQKSKWASPFRNSAKSSESRSGSGRHVSLSYDEEDDRDQLKDADLDDDLDDGDDISMHRLKAQGHDGQFGGHAHPNSNLQASRTSVCHRSGLIDYDVEYHIAAEETTTLLSHRQLGQGTAASTREQATSSVQKLLSELDLEPIYTTEDLDFYDI